MSAPQTAGLAAEAAPQRLATDAIINKYNADRNCLIQILLELQQRDHWLSEEDLALVSRRLDAPLTQVYHVATFYKAFSLVPRGEHLISVCLGTACQVRGASRLLDRVTEIFKIKPGQTSPDKRYTLSTVNCLGCCALGPVMMIDDQYYSKPTKEELEQLAAAE